MQSKLPKATKDKTMQFILLNFTHKEIQSVIDFINEKPLK